jgi:hypothetical protein
VNIGDHQCFFENSRVLFSFGLDPVYSHFQYRNYEEYIIDLLTYAHNNNKIVIFTAHRPVENITGDYQTSFSALEMICNFVNVNNMQYYTLSELGGKINPSAQSARFVSNPENIETIEDNLSPSINIFPNPFDDKENIQFVVQNNEELVNLCILDLNGKTIRTLVVNRLSPDIHTIIWDGLDDSGIIAKSGLYIIRLNIGKECLYKRVIKL